MTSSRLRLRLSSTAIQKTKEQSNYYLAKSGEPLAMRWRAVVNAAIRSLRTFPERGAPCHFTKSFLRDVRRLPIKGFPRHLVMYRYDRESGEVFILNVIHAARDIEAALSTPQ